MRSARIATAILRLYPRTWRLRYQTEVLALLDDGQVTRGDVVDVMRGCLSEWKAAAADPEHHPVAFQFLTGLRWLMILLAFLVPTVGTAWWLQAKVGPPPDWVSNLFFVIASVVIGTVLTMLFRRKQFSNTALMGWVPALAVTMVLAVWVDGLPVIRTTRPHMSGFTSLYIVLWFMSSVHRPRFMSDLVAAMGGRRYLLSWANMELARCQSLPENDPWRAPQLASAQAEVDRLNHELQSIYAAIRERRPLPAAVTRT